MSITTYTWNLYIVQSMPKLGFSLFGRLQSVKLGLHCACRPMHSDASFYVHPFGGEAHSVAAASQVVCVGISGQLRSAKSLLESTADIKHVCVCVRDVKHFASMRGCCCCCHKIPCGL